MDSYYSSNYGNKIGEDVHAKKTAASKLMDSSELNRSSKHIDSGVCVESLSSVSSILTSSSSLSSNYSLSKKSTTNKHTSSSSISNTPSSKYTNSKGLLESAELYEYDYDEKEDEYDYERSTDYDLINEQKLVNQQLPYLSDADLLETDKNGNTMLHLAIIEHKTQLVYHIMSLFQHPDYLDIRNKWSQSALHLACLTEQIKIVRRLIACGATINLIDSQGNTCLHTACRTGDLDLVKQFFQPITRAEIADMNYKISANCVNFKKFILNEKNYEGENCVFMAAESGNFELIKYLVIQGAEINSQELKDGNTVLHLAVTKLKSVDLIEFLIKSCGAHINKVNYANQTPLSLAWNMLNKNPNSRRIKIMIHLLKEYGGQPSEYESEIDSSSDELENSSNDELSD